MGWIYTPTRLVTGPGSIEQLGLIAQELGNRALLVTEEVLGTWGIVELIRKSLESAGVHAVVFNEIGFDSGSEAAERAASVARTSKAQLIIGLGGIKAASLAKCAARLAPGAQLLDFVIPGSDFDPGALPYIEVPTTPRSPFLMTDQVLVIDERDRRTHLLKTGLYTSSAVIDPKLTLSLSPKQTALMMMELLLTAVEGYASLKRSFLAKTLLMNVFKPLLHTVKRSFEEPKLLDHRRLAMEKGVETSVALASSTLGLGTAAAFAVGGRYSIPHAWISTVLLPHILEWLHTAAPEALEEIASYVEEDLMGKPIKNGMELIEFVRYLTASLKMPLRLSSFSVTRQELTGCIDTILALGGGSYLPVSVSSGDIDKILKRAF
ncbi:MAG: iron-containing alcohol dehydrogenase [Spirochaetia bacterium]